MELVKYAELHDFITSVYMTEIANFRTERWVIYSTPQPMVCIEYPFVRLATYPGIFVNYHLDVIDNDIKLTIPI